MAQPSKPHFVHAVYFWLKQDLTHEEQVTFLRGLESLVGIDTVQQGFIGQPAPTRREIIDSTYSYALVLVFKDKAAHDAYQEHEVHDRFRDECGTFWSAVKIYDSVSH